jgi:hypothetical protein
MRLKSALLRVSARRSGSRIPPGVSKAAPGLLAEAKALASTEQSYCLTLTHLFLAMAEQRLGHVAVSRRELDAARKLLEGLGRLHGWWDSSDTELMDYGWSEWVIATVVGREAEALILYDPLFPADPFAP